MGANWNARVWTEKKVEKMGKKGIGIVIAKEKYRAIRRRGRQWRDSSIARKGYEGLIMA